MKKRFILNADGFGLSNAVNRAVAELYESGFLKSVSIAPNGDAYDEAVNVVLPKCPELGAGIHLNILSGLSVCSDVDLLADENRNFKNSYLKILINALNPKNQEFLSQIEREFRRQIEKVLSSVKVSHIDSLGHIHSIFDIVCRLAKEYNIPQVRTHYEKFYIVPDIYRHFNKNYLKNILYKFVLNLFTIFNENTVNQYGLKTNDYLIGIEYANAMDSLAVAYGIKALKYENITVETALHPCRYEEGTIDNYFDEYMIARNKKLEDKILRSGYDITNYKQPEEDNTPE